MTGHLLAVVLPALGCLLAGLLGGRAWGRACADDAWADGYNQAARDEQETRGPDPVFWPEDWAEVGGRVIVEVDELPLVPLPGRLPDADTLTRMYAQLGERPTDLPPAGAASTETLGPRPGEAPLWNVSGEHEERAPTIAELAADAEYRVCWTELAGLRKAAEDWYEETYATGAFRAVQ